MTVHGLMRSRQRIGSTMPGNPVSDCGPCEKNIAKLGEELSLSPPEPADIESWATLQWVQQNHSVIAAINAAEVARKSIEIAVSGHYPTLDGGIVWNRPSNADEGSDHNTGKIGFELNILSVSGWWGEFQSSARPNMITEAAMAFWIGRRSVNTGYTQRLP